MKNWKRKYTSFKEKQHSKTLGARPEQKLGSLLEPNLQSILQVLGEDGDLIIRRFRMYGLYDAAIIFFSSMADLSQIHEHLLKPLMNPPADPTSLPADSRDLPDFIWNLTIHVAQGDRTSDLSSLPDSLVAGNVVLLVNSMEQALYFNLRKIEQRSIEQPQTEQILRGSREGFIENLESNLSLLRYRLQTPDFRVQTCPLGARTHSQVAVCYIDGIANPALVEEVMRRLSMIHTDSIIDAGYIEQFIEDQPLSPFPQVQPTERPDRSTAALLEGRVIILVDGSPFSLIVPALFNQFLQTMDDYTERFIVGSLIRFVRLIALIFSLFFPALYVSIISFNPELMPTEFAVAISGGRAGVPFPAVLEVLVMEVSMEVLREATIRLPQMIGGALSIVGVLVVGQAAVAAGLASPTTVVIVALTTIGSFATPAYNAAIALRMLRFPLILMAGLFGLYGVMIGTIAVINHLLVLESFGVPYMTPYVPAVWRDMKDSLVRAPLWWIKRRPSFLHASDPDRLSRSMPKEYAAQIFTEEGEPYEQHPANHDPSGHSGNH
ncbi:spore germination protein [Paenibacillus albidus]|uniref:spore germination protein n=1 Tax=Paenibacillus albidus TaxID=2041023 RepID=UPI001BE9FF65|nr:spore germination protein [Paenibacillus albidus]